MKRTFDCTDYSQPQSLLDSYPNHSFALNQMYGLEKDINLEWIHNRRYGSILNSEPPTVSKLMRIFIRHQFFPGDEENKSCHVLNLEGIILDTRYRYLYHFCQFFERIRIQVDKRFQPVNNIYEWYSPTLISGNLADCLTIKIFADKLVPIRISLCRSKNVKVRHEINSPLLRELFPRLRVDVSFEDILTALLAYFDDKDLFDKKDKRTIRCNEELKAIFNTETLNIFTLKLRLKEMLQPCKPIIIDYSLIPITTPTGLEDGDKRFGPLSLYRSGGKAVDVEVDVPDQFSLERLRMMNRSSRLPNQLAGSLSKMQVRSEFLSNLATSLRNKLTSLKDVRNIFESIGSSSNDSNETDCSLLHEVAVKRPCHASPTATTTTAAAATITGTSDWSGYACRASDIKSLISQRSIAAASPSLDPTAAATTTTDKSGVSSGTRLSRRVPPSHRVSAIHNAPHYIDINSDELFSSDNVWTKSYISQFIQQSEQTRKELERKRSEEQQDGGEEEEIDVDDEKEEEMEEEKEEEMEEKEKEEKEIEEEERKDIDPSNSNDNTEFSTTTDDGIEVESVREGKAVTEDN